jgi:hypothetical protein
VLIFIAEDTVLCVCVCVIATTRKCLWYSVATICQRLQRSRGDTGVHPEQSSKQGPWQEELHAKCIVKTKRVSAEPSAIEGPSAGGWAG